MRWDEALDRTIRDERLKERDTACCIRKDRAGCVQVRSSFLTYFMEQLRLKKWEIAAFSNGGGGIFSVLI